MLGHAPQPVASYQGHWIEDYNSLPAGRLQLVGVDAKGSKVTNLGLERETASRPPLLYSNIDHAAVVVTPLVGRSLLTPLGCPGADLIPLKTLKIANFSNCQYVGDGGLDVCLGARECLSRFESPHD